MPVFVSVKHENEPVMPAELTMADEISLSDPLTVVNGKFTCDCGRLYKRKSDMTRHQRVECGKEPQIMCNLCPYRAKRRSHLVSHFKYKHKMFTLM